MALVHKIECETKILVERLRADVIEANECFEDNETVPSEVTFGHAKQLILDLAKHHLELPSRVYPARTGKIAFVWGTGAEKIEALIGTDGTPYNYPYSHPHSVGKEKLFEELQSSQKTKACP